MFYSEKIGSKLVDQIAPWNEQIGRTSKIFSQSISSQLCIMLLSRIEKSHRGRHLQRALWVNILFNRQCRIHLVDTTRVDWSKRLNNSSYAMLQDDHRRHSSRCPLSNGNSWGGNNIRGQIGGVRWSDIGFIRFHVTLCRRSTVLPLPKKEVNKTIWPLYYSRRPIGR